MKMTDFTFTSDVSNRAAYFRNDIPSPQYPVSFTLHSPLRDAPWVCADCESRGRLLGVEVLGIDINLPRPLVTKLSGASSGTVQLSYTADELIFDARAAILAPWATYRLMMPNRAEHAEARFNAEERLTSIKFSWNVFEVDSPTSRA